MKTASSSDLLERISEAQYVSGAPAVSLAAKFAVRQVVTFPLPEARFDGASIESHMEAAINEAVETDGYTVPAGVFYPAHGVLPSPMHAAGAMALSVFALGNVLRLRRFHARMQAWPAPLCTGNSHPIFWVCTAATSC